MKKYTQFDLEEMGYNVENVLIDSVDLSMDDHGILVMSIGISGSGWGCTIGSYAIGKGYLGAKDFSGSPKGIESIMRIMDTVGVSRMSDMKGKYIRVASKGWGSIIKIFGNIIEDKWFDYESFFSDD